MSSSASWSSRSAVILLHVATFVPCRSADGLLLGGHVGLAVAAAQILLEDGQVGGHGEFHGPLVAGHNEDGRLRQVAHDHAAVVGGAEVGVGHGLAVGLDDGFKAKALRRLHTLHAPAVGHGSEHAAVHLHHGIDRRQTGAHGFILIQRAANVVNHPGRHQWSRGVVEKQAHGRGIAVGGIGADGRQTGVGALGTAVEDAAHLAPAATLHHGLHLSAVVGVHHHGHLVDERVGVKGFDAVLQHRPPRQLHILLGHVAPHAPA